MLREFPAAGGRQVEGRDLEAGGMLVGRGEGGGGEGGGLIPRGEGGGGTKRVSSRIRSADLTVLSETIHVEESRSSVAEERP